LQRNLPNFACKAGPSTPSETGAGEVAELVAEADRLVRLYTRTGAYEKALACLEK